MSEKPTHTLATTTTERAICRICLNEFGGITVEAPTVKEVKQLLDKALTVKQRKPLQEAIR
jgi:hypothetical protein